MARPAGKVTATPEPKTEKISASLPGKERPKARQKRKRNNPLLIMLAAIFGVQMTLFIGSTIWCMNDHMQHCDEVGRRYDETFGTAIATVLALMHGGGAK